MSSSTANQIEAIHCGNCRALLFKAAPGAIAATIEIKCRRCGSINSLRPQSPNPTAFRAANGGLPCGSMYPRRA